LFVAADAHDIVAADGERLVDGELFIDGNDFAVVQNQVRAVCGVSGREGQDHQARDDPPNRTAGKHDADSEAVWNAGKSGDPEKAYRSHHPCACAGEEKRRAGAPATSSRLCIMICFSESEETTNGRTIPRRSILRWGGTHDYLDCTWSVTD